jgi:hypothetical protein
MDKLNSKNTMEVQKFSTPANQANPSFTVDQTDIDQLSLVHKKLSSLYKKCLFSFFSFNSFLQKLLKSSFETISTNHQYNTILPQDQLIIQKLITHKAKGTQRLLSLRQENFDLIEILKAKENTITGYGEKISGLEENLIELSEQQKKYGFDECDDITAITDDLKMLNDNEEMLSELNDQIRGLTEGLAAKEVLLGEREGRLREAERQVGELGGRVVEVQKVNNDLKVCSAFFFF